MARIKFGALLSDISGSIAGFTFQRSGYGSSVRKKPVSSVSDSSSSFLVKSRLSEVIALWASMSSEQRLAWDRFSSFHPQFSYFNKSSLLSGYNLFMKYNLIRRAAAWPAISTFSFFVPQLSPSAPTIRLIGFDLLVNVGVGPHAYEFGLLLSMSKPYRQGMFIANNQLRVLTGFLWAGNAINVSEFYYKKFGKLPDVGDSVKISCVVFSMKAPVMYPTWLGDVIVSS